MRRLFLLTIAVVVVARPLNAQIAVYDPANTARNCDHGHHQGVPPRDAARAARQDPTNGADGSASLPTFDDSSCSILPRWRTHGGDFLYANGINDALIFGDPAGAAYLAVSHPVVRARALLGRLTPAAQRAMTSRLATLELADAAAMSATNDTGSAALQRPQAGTAGDRCPRGPRHRPVGRAERHRGAGQDQRRRPHRRPTAAGARASCWPAFVEQLLVDTKRARDADAAAMNMQIVTWRDRRAANEAFVAGTGDALRTWRQP